MRFRRRLNRVDSRLDMLGDRTESLGTQVTALQSDLKLSNSSRWEKPSFWASLVGIVLSTVLVIVQCVLLSRQTDILDSQKQLTVLQQQQGTDSYDFSVAGKITLSRPDAQTVVLENRSPNGVFDGFVQLQGVGSFSGATQDGVVFAHVLQRIDILASCEKVTFQVPPNFSNNNYGDALYLEEQLTALGEELTGFSSGTAMLVFEGSEHWWAVSEDGGIFRMDAAAPRETQIPSDELLMQLDRSLPEDRVLGDTVLEGVDFEGLTAISGSYFRDSDLVKYDDFNYEIGRSEREAPIRHESIQGCSYG